jgi:hypothetical protein
MKKNAYLFLFSQLLLICSINAQQVTLNWGEESKVELDYNSFVTGKGTDLIKLCFEYSGGGLFGGKRTVTPVVSRYNSKLAEQGVKRYEVDEKGISFLNLLSVKEKLHLFTSQYDKATKATSFYCQTLDVVSLNPKGNPKNLGSFDAINKSAQSTVGYEVSKDSSKILMLGLSPYSKKENEKYYIAVYDDNMNKQWDNTVELPYKDKFVEIFDRLVTNDGKVGVLIKHYDQEVTKETVKVGGEKIPSYTTKFLLYEKGVDKPTEYILNLNSKFIHTLQLTSDIDNNLTLFGLYKNKYDGYVSGYFITTIDKVTKAVNNVKMDAFPMEFLEMIKKDKQGSDKEKDPGLYNAFSLATVVDRNDGSKDYILEYRSEVYIQPSSYRSNGMWVSTPGYWIYNYGDIIDICIKPNNSTVLTRIPKMQTSKNIRIYSNFQALTYKDKLLLFYNDDKDNVDRDLAKKPETLTKFNKCVLVKTVVDAKGSFTRESVFDHSDTKLTVCVRECVIVGKNRIGLYAQKNGGLFAAAKDMIGVLEVK